MEKYVAWIGVRFAAPERRPLFSLLREVEESWDMEMFVRLASGSDSGPSRI